MKAPLSLVAVAFLVATLPAADPPAVALKVHPKVFSLVACWESDSESPVVTEINLDAVEANRNQFDGDAVKLEDGWTRCPGEDGRGFFRYRALEQKAGRYKVEFQSNGGGTLTSASEIECSVEQRKVTVGGEAKLIRVLRVLEFRSK